MKLLGREISGAALLDELEARLRARGLTDGTGASSGGEVEGVAPPVDPLRFNLRALEEHADPLRPVPLHTHRGGLAGRLVLLSKSLASRGGRVLLASALERQRIFNGHVRDSYAQLSAEVLRLTAQVDRLNAKLDVALAEGPAGAEKSTPVASAPEAKTTGTRARAKRTNAKKASAGTATKNAGAGAAAKNAGAGAAAEKSLGPAPRRAPAASAPKKPRRR